MTQTMNMDITSANASAILTVEGIFPSGLELKMFSTDQMLSMDSIDITETRKGVDGFMVAGYIPVIYPLTLMLEAASPSHASLGTVWQAMAANKRIYACNLVCTIPSIGKVYTWSRGVIKSGIVLPSLKKVLDPTTWVFHFENFEQSKI